MPVPVATLALALSPMFAALARLIVGAGVAILTYTLIDSTVRPYFEDLFISLISTAQDMNSVASAGASLYGYFEFTKVIQLIVSCYWAAFSIRIARLSFSAFSTVKA